MLFGFDLAAGGGQDAVVAETLLGGSPIAQLLETDGARLIDCQPVLGFSLAGGVEAYFEVKTRPASARRERGEEPISVYLTLRRAGPVDELKQLTEIFDDLSMRGEEIVETRVLPTLVNPIRRGIIPGM
ncbi:MAG: hypothetical protein IPJ41_13380 [Phycisphaerales bacterium]|nr:hypothetical protein [Phycisphaerales bacterium]